MNIETRKILFVQEFLKLQDEELISGLEKLLHEQRIELVESELKPMTMEQFNAGIDQSLEDSKNGRVIEVSELKKEIKQWQ